MSSSVSSSMSEDVCIALLLQLRPLDARMWCAMGQCYEHEQLGMDEAAARCYQRAQGSGDREGGSHTLSLLPFLGSSSVPGRHKYVLCLSTCPCPCTCMSLSLSLCPVQPYSCRVEKEEHDRVWQSVPRPKLKLRRHRAA